MTYLEDDPQVLTTCTHEPIVVDGKVKCAKCGCSFSLMAFFPVDQDDFWE